MWQRRQRKGMRRMLIVCIELCLGMGGSLRKALRCLIYSLVRGQGSSLFSQKAEIQTSTYPCWEADDCQRPVWVLSQYVNHSLEKVWVNSTSCYTNSRTKRNLLLQCSWSLCTSSEPNVHAPVSQMSSVEVVAFAASVELTSSPALQVDSVGNSGDSRNINIRGKKFKERGQESWGPVRIEPGKGSER